LGDMIPRLNPFDLLLSMILYMNQRWWLGLAPVLEACYDR
jgi:hypothetical protein